VALVEQLPAETYLKERGVRIEVIPHTQVQSAVDEAGVMGLPAGCVLKVVILRFDDDYAMAVLPASHRIDMSLVREIAPDQDVRLATEGEIESRFPDFDLGALPPLPGLLGVRAYVDPTAFDHYEVAFADGRQTESIIASSRELFWGEDALVEPIARSFEA